MEIIPNKSNYATNSAMATVDESQGEGQQQDQIANMLSKKEEEQAKRVEEERQRISALLDQIETDFNT